MEKKLRKRVATNEDGERVRGVVEAVLQEYGLDGDPEGVDADLVDLEASYVASGGLFAVLEDVRGEIVGTMGLYPKGEGVCELRKMYLKRAFRGQGWGKKMLEYLLVQAAALGFRRVELETASVLREAVGLYERYGFKPFVHAHLACRCDAAYALDLEEPLGWESPEGWG